MTHHKPVLEEVVALLPAGGQATRLAPLPVSKELLPIGFYSTPPEGSLRPKSVSHYLLEKLQRAGVQKAFFILRPGKWDIPAYFGDGRLVGLHLAYLTVHVTHGVPYTLNQAYPFIRGMRVALGFPDILFEPEDAFQKILFRQEQTAADVVLGLFPTAYHWKAGMVEFEPSGRVVRLVEKPAQSELKYMWAIACWSPQFTEFLHHYLATLPTPRQEIPIGDVIQAGIDRGLRVEAEVFPNGSYLDVGTPEDLVRAVQTGGRWQQE